MSNHDKVTAHAYAGLIAASGAVAAKRVPRLPVPGVLPRGIRLPRVQDTPHLFEATHDSAETDHKLARIAAASLLYSVEKKPRGYAEQLLAPRERDILRAVHDERDRGRPKRDIRCRYCHLSSALYNHALYSNPVGGYDPHATQKFVVVRHSATVKTSFDPDTYASSAKIENYQVLLPRELAIKLVRRSHPLSWHDAAPKLFLDSLPAVLAKNEWRPAPEKSHAEWEKEARVAAAYLYERVALAISSDASSEIVNAIRITGFRNGEDPHHCRLKFRYDLQSCLESNFAIVREPGGLDLDGGITDSRACHPDAIEIADLKGMTERDRVQLDLAPTARQMVDSDAPDSPPLGDEELKKVVKELQDMASHLGGNDPWWLVTINASKRLRFTAPGNTPVDVWGTLTFLGPALVFTFINRAVCQAAADLTSQPAAVAPPGPNVRPSRIRPTAPAGARAVRIPSPEAADLAFVRQEAYKRTGSADKPGHGKRRRAR
jgi:hypothetical protein